MSLLFWLEKEMSFHPLTDRWTPRKTCLPEFTGTHYPENARKFLRTQEYSIFSKSSWKGAHWKTSLSLNSRALPARENAQENEGMHDYFRGFSERYHATSVPYPISSPEWWYFLIFFSTHRLFTQRKNSFTDAFLWLPWYSDLHKKLFLCVLFRHTRMK